MIEPVWSRRTVPCAMAWGVALLSSLPGCMQSEADRGAALGFPGPRPGRAVVLVDRAVGCSQELVLSNDVMETVWGFESEPVDGRGEPMNGLQLRRVVNRMTGQVLEPDGEVFEIELADGTVLRASDLWVSARWWATLPADRTSTRPGRRSPGRALILTLIDPSLRVVVDWRVELRDDANSIRQALDIRAAGEPVDVAAVVLNDFAVPGAALSGAVRGSVAVVGDVFLAMEHPMAETAAGHPLEPLGQWQPEQMSWPDRRDIRWDASDAVTTAGAYDVEFTYQAGSHRLDIFDVHLLEDGRSIARDEHAGFTGIAEENNRYRLLVEAPRGDARYELVATIRSDGGTDSHGVVAMGRVGESTRVRSALPLDRPVISTEPLRVSGVIGVVPAGQLRRGFLYYLERERAHPYRPFLHYNSWYDIGYFSTFDEADCLAVIAAFGTQLHERRGVTLDSFLFDDGWDDPASLWHFHDGLPRGFAEIAAATARCGAAPGVWLSPWGGYGQPRERRLACGAEAGFETNDRGFALSAPRYYERFEAICLEMIAAYGVNQFKFDGIGQASERFPGSRFGSDFEAAIHLIARLREARPDVYINLTTGTWPSPFWLQHADSIWRGGYDHEFLGVGSDRQQWMTYRDAMTHRNIVRQAPLYPLSSLMVHGVIFAKHARRLDTASRQDLRDEMRSAFGAGSQLQELYITPALMRPGQWDDLAESARWARRNAATLRDTHWIGGDPEQLQVYGWASWSPAKGIVTLRNPADRPQPFELDVQSLFELPSSAQRRYRLQSAYADPPRDPVYLIAGQTHSVTLRPFEVMVLEALPIGQSD